MTQSKLCGVSDQFRQIPTGGGKERGRGATRGGAHNGKTHSIQGKHRAGAKVLRPAYTIHAGNGYDPATCGLEILLASSKRAPAANHARERAVVGAGRWSLRKH